MAIVNKYKDRGQFTQDDYVVASKMGKVLIAMLREAFVGHDVTSSENDSQSRSDIYDVSPGMEDGADLKVGIDGVTLHFELTGDRKWLASNSKKLPFNKAAVKKLLLKEAAGGHAIAAYYLALESPPKFFFMGAKYILNRYESRYTESTSRGMDQGMKYWIPFGDWCSFDALTARIRKELRSGGFAPRSRY